MKNEAQKIGFESTQKKSGNTRTMVVMQSEKVNLKKSATKNPDSDCRNTGISSINLKAVGISNFK